MNKTGQLMTLSPLHNRQAVSLHLGEQRTLRIHHRNMAQQRWGRDAVFSGGFFYISKQSPDKIPQSPRCSIHELMKIPPSTIWVICMGEIKRIFFYLMRFEGYSDVSGGSLHWRANKIITLLSVVLGRKMWARIPWTLQLMRWETAAFEHWGITSNKWPWPCVSISISIFSHFIWTYCFAKQIVWGNIPQTGTLEHWRQRKEGLGQILPSQMQCVTL